MKKLMWVMFLMFGFIAVGNTQDTLEILQYPEEQDQVLEKIEIRELPEIARHALNSQDYNNWVVNAAYRTSVADPNDPLDMGNVNYLVELKKGEERKTIRFDENGTQIKDGDEP